MQICARCHKTRYCSKPCQKRHWKAGHKQECKEEEKVVEEEKVEEKKVEEEEEKTLFTGMDDWEVRQLNKKRANSNRQHCGG